jgi:hypothetical protein
VVLTDSHRISRVPYYLGSFSSVHNVSTTGLAPSMTGLSRPFVYIAFYCCCSVEQLKSPATPTMQRLPAITHDRFSLFRVRSPLLTESLLFSLPVGTEMFHFPTFPLSRLYIQREVTGSSPAGFPHSEILGSKFVYQLPEAYRRLLRPSSAPIAKASTVCS